MILDAELYLKRRKENPLTKYRLWRRINKTAEMIKQYVDGKTGLKLLDIGAADGTMLDVLKKKFNLLRAVGIEPNKGLVDAKVSSEIELFQGFGENLPFKNSEFDIVVISAVIEHVNSPQKVIQEAYRVLSENGLLIIITVVPWIDKLAEKFGIFPKTLHRHFHRFSLKKLGKLLKDEKFEVLNLEKFALPTSGFLLYENKLEKVLNKLGLNFFMTYELAVARKGVSG